MVWTPLITVRLLSADKSCHPERASKKGRHFVILSVLAKDLAAIVGARSFASTLRMTTRQGSHFLDARSGRHKASDRGCVHGIAVSIHPPPSTTSPSYSTTACPGVIALCG